LRKEEGVELTNAVPVRAVVGSALAALVGGQSSTCARLPYGSVPVRVGYLTKGKGSGIASKGKDDPKKRMVMITLLCEKEV